METPMNKDIELNEDVELNEDIALDDRVDFGDTAVLLNGKWENTDRSVGSAAILGLLGIGLIYFVGCLK